jgi:hypothetical protein
VKDGCEPQASGHRRDRRAKRARRSPR